MTPPETAEALAAIRAALAHQAALGADEAILEHPVDRTAAAAEPAAALLESRASSVAPPAPAGSRGAATVARAADGPPSPPAATGALATSTPPAAPRARDRSTGDTPDARPAREIAAGIESLDALAAALAAWDGSELRHGARSCVVSDGLPGARVMVIGEAPGADEDRLGRPFVGRAGKLLDRMLATIGLSRTAEDPARAVYITNILPWRPPGNRTPSEAEAALFLPFVERHIALARPDLILAIGNTPVKALLATTTGIRRMRGTWRRHAASGLPLLPSFHPAYLLRQPAEKRHAWADLLALRRALDGAAIPIDAP